MKKILVIQNKRIGDVLLASLIATNLKSVFPDSVIDFMVYDYTTGVIENHPAIDNIIPIKEKELKKANSLSNNQRTLQKKQRGTDDNS